ncbi:MAG: hypothetical protein WKF76_11115 [Nocardioidaceae bacterium]
MSHAPRRRLVSVVVGSSALALAVAGLTVGTTAAPSNAQSDPTGADCLRAVGNGPVAQARQRTFAAAASTYDVPTSVLLGVSYLESRWDDHGASPSTSGGYGPMHLTDVAVPDNSLAKGDGTVRRSDGPAALHTASTAAALTKLSVRRLTSDDVANICGGAALLASYQRDLGKATGTTTTAASWYGAVKTYSGAATAADETTFAQRVYSTLKSGEQRTTIDGQRLQLAAQPQIATESELERPARQPTAAPSTWTARARLDCEWIPAPYEWYGAPNPSPTATTTTPTASKTSTSTTSSSTTPRRATPTTIAAGHRPDVRLVELHDPLERRPRRPAPRRQGHRASRPATGTSTCTRSASSTRASPPTAPPGTPRRCTRTRRSW